MKKYILIAILLICIIIATPVLINETILYSFLRVEYSLNTLDNPEEFPAATAEQYRKGYAREVFYTFGKKYNLPLKYFDLTVPATQESDTAILLIHGYCRNQSDMYWLRKQFQGTNSWVFTVNLTPELAGIDAIAKASIIPKIAQIKQQSGCKKIILIGSSMGGLVASYYKEYLDKDNDVKAVITLGSPLHGTTVAVVAPGVNSRQMCPNSPFLQELRARMNLHPQYYYQVLSKFDNIVFPWDSAFLEHTAQTQQFIVPFESHLGLLHNTAIAENLNAWVKQIKNN